MDEAPRLSPEKLVCANCVVKMRGQAPPGLLLRCGGCRLLHYCSAVCQTEDWHANHSSLCKIFSRKKKISETEHKEGSCQTCSLESYWLTKKSIVKFYWDKFGYNVAVPVDKTKEEDYPWQCPYQLGECTGNYLGWVDEYLAKIDELFLRKGSKCTECMVVSRYHLDSSLKKIDVFTFVF